MVMKKKRILGVVLASALLIGTFAACTPTQQPAAAPDTGGIAVTPPPTGGTVPPPLPPPEQAIERGLNIAIQAETPTLAPARHTALIGGFKNNLTHNGLFRVNYEDLEPVPDLVASWRSLSDTLFEFTLHEGVMFHNGEELTAEDVVASMHYVRTYPEARVFHGSVVDAEVVDRYTFILDTGEPNALLFFELSHQANLIMPKSLIDGGNDFNVNPVGSGSFEFYDWSLGDSLTFTRFDDYFDADRFPQVDYIHWRIIPEGASRTIALETGEVDFIVEVAFPDIPRMRENPEITVFERPGLTFIYLLLNNSTPMFENIHVRHAIDMAIDKEAIVLAAVDGFGVPVSVSVPPVFPGVSHDGTRSFDPDAARALLAEHNIDPSTLDFDMLVYSEEHRRRAEVVQANLADLGINTTITMIDFATWLTAAGTTDAAFGAFTSANLLSFMRSTMHVESIPAPNRSRITNQVLSDLITEAIQTVDPAARLAVTQEATRVANEHSGFIPLHMNVLVRAFNSNLVVPEIAASGAMNLNMAYWVE
ncbi:MAG: ABC transporter substrate-binding protein [Defluviitaleaceae bacterium]|nr:ABC transporter substrate-binding protein [Defluviitaleaceae bacterium]